MYLRVRGFGFDSFYVLTAVYLIFFNCTDNRV